MFKNLYDCFQNWYSGGGSVFFYSDPHFGDLESYKFRFPEEFKFEGGGERPTDEWIVRQLDGIQIQHINQICTKRDCLVILGDVGDIEQVRKIKAGYKVLIMGNHDRGATNYKRIVRDRFINFCPYCHKELPKGTLRKDEYETYNSVYDFEEGYCPHCGEFIRVDSGGCSKYIPEDNQLFDEIYEGTLQISPKIILSHEPIDYKYCFNIHGHVHSLDYKNDSTHLNCCAEHINYKPICIKKLIQDGVFKNIPDIHRETIEKR